MKPRKTPHADLERERSLFFEISMVFILGLVVFLFNLNFKSRPIKFSDSPADYTWHQEIVPIKRQQEILTPPIPPTPVKVYDVINIVQDDVEIDEELEIFDSENSEDKEIEFVAPVKYEMKEEEEDMPIFVVVEDMPIFRPDICQTYEESQKELLKYVSESIRFPAVATEYGIQGLVYVSFVVSPRGKVTNVKLVRGIQKDLDAEAIRVVKSLPDFEPGKQRGKPVRVEFTLPIRFVLKD